MYGELTMYTPPQTTLNALKKKTKSHKNAMWYVTNIIAIL